MKPLKKKVLLMILAAILFSLVPSVEVSQNPLLITSQAASANGISISAKKKTLNVGKSFTLKIKGTSKKVKWSSSDKKIATVNSKGKVTAKNPGTAIITAKVGSKTLTCKVTVKGTLSVDKTEVTLKESNKKVVVTYKESGSVRFRVADPNIVTCKWGNWSGNKIPLTIIPGKPGTTTIKITNSKNKESITIKVTVLSPVEIILPTLPQKVSEYTLGSLDSVCKVTDIQIDSWRTSDGTYWVDAIITGEKTWDDKPYNSSSCKIGYKLYDSQGIVVESGVIYTNSVSVGEKFRENKALSYGLPAGKYILKLMDVG